ncbi:unnamed protein product, partial [Prorocentrum cordatum]
WPWRAPRSRRRFQRQHGAARGRCARAAGAHGPRAPSAPAPGSAPRPPRTSGHALQ